MQMLLFFFMSNTSHKDLITYVTRGTYYCNDLCSRAFEHTQKHLQLLQGDPNSPVSSDKNVHLHREPKSKQ